MLMSILGDDPVNVIVSQTTSPSGDVAWRATFLSHLEVRRTSRHTYMSLAYRREVCNAALRVLLNDCPWIVWP